MQLDNRPLIAALARMSEAEIREWADCYDELAQALRLLFPTPAAEARWIANRIIERERLPVFTSETK